MAVSDLGSLTTSVWTCLCFTPSFRESDLPFDSINYQTYTGGFLHTAFARVTAWITAVVTLERCLCITVPMKVRSIVTSKRMIILNICVFIVVLSTVSPVYIAYRLGPIFFIDKNKTLITVLANQHQEIIQTIVFPITNFFLPAIAFVVIIASTIILVYKLTSQNRWRKKSSSTFKGDSVYNRNINVAKMVTMVAILFIASFCPMCAIFIGMSLEPKLGVGGQYANTLSVLGGFCLLLETINSSSNIFIYYHMSSKYKEVFANLFRISKSQCSA